MSIPLSHQYQPFPKPVTPPGDNLGDFCVTVDGKWIPYLLGAISILAVDRTWAFDADRATGEARNLLEQFMAALPCPIPDIAGSEGDDCMGCCLRWSEAGILEQFTCGAWTPVPGPGSTIPITGVPGPTATPQPGPGDCEQFIGKVLFFGRWLLPVSVSAGDTVHVTNALGATQDYIVDYPAYRCGDGTEFIFNGCLSGSEIFNGSDPAPAYHHGNLIAYDGTNYYDCGQAANGIEVVLTIKPGISDAPLQFLINSPGPGGTGDITFDVRICKAAASPIFITYDLGSGPAGVAEGEVFTITSTCCGGGGSGDYGVFMNFNVPVKLTVFDEGTFSLVGCTTHDLWMKGELSGSDVQIHYCDTSTHVTDWSPVSTIDHWQAECGACGAAWTIQVKLERA